MSARAGTKNPMAAVSGEQQSMSNRQRETTLVPPDAVELSRHRRIRRAHARLAAAAAAVEEIANNDRRRRRSGHWRRTAFAAPLACRRLLHTHARDILDRRHQPREGRRQEHERLGRLAVPAEAAGWAASSVDAAYKASSADPSQRWTSASMYNPVRDGRLRHRPAGQNRWPLRRVGEAAVSRALHAHADAAGLHRRQHRAVRQHRRRVIAWVASLPTPRSMLALTCRVCAACATPMSGCRCCSRCMSAAS